MFERSTLSAEVERGNSKRVKRGNGAHTFINSNREGNYGRNCNREM